MADFRKWIYTLAPVALLAGLTIPASAQTQSPPFQCQTNTGTPPIIRAEGYTELVGDLILTCTGGIPTTAGNPVPQVNFQIFVNTNVTSRLLTNNSSGPNFNEALLIIDEPNSAINPHRGILPCGTSNEAPDDGPSGPGVCAIISDGIPQDTYDGLGDKVWVGPGIGQGGDQTCVAVTSSNSSSGTSYGCGNPNVFQGRQAISGANGGQTNSVIWLGVPLDPPGTTTNRIIRITNVRVNAVGVGVSSTFTTSQIQMNVSVSGTTSLSINNPQQIVAYVQKGLITTVANSRSDFVQCNPENPDLYLSTTSTPNSKFTVPAYRGDTSSCNSIIAESSSSCKPAAEGYNQAGGYNANNNPFFPISAGNAIATTVVSDNTPVFRFQEGFASSWKAKNLEEFLANGTVVNNISGADYEYNGGLENHSTVSGDLVQNVPGAIYNTESGFEFNSANGTPSPNPPLGFGTTAVGGYTTPNTNFGSTDTGTNGAGVADHGTRLALSLTNVPNGVAAFVPPVIYLYRQGNSLTKGANGDPTLYVSGFSTGVMVLTSTDANGGGGISPPASLPAGSTPQAFLPLSPVPTSGLVVYEILFADPFSLEQADVPVVVAYQTNLAANLPQTGISTQVAGGFAPFYSTAAASTASVYGSTPDVPRFIPASTPATLFTISTCSCNLLFPYVASSSGYDTGIAIANTSQDPGSTYGFMGKPQSGTVTFWYYGTIPATGASAPPFQTSAIVPNGQVLTYVLSNGGGSIGTAASGLDNRAAGFVGYIIAQAGFQYCHAYAFIGALGAAPTASGISEGYLGIILDKGGLPRTNQIGENDAH